VKQGSIKSKGSTQEEDEIPRASALKTDGEELDPGLRGDLSKAETGMAVRGTYLQDKGRNCSYQRKTTNI